MDWRGGGRQPDGWPVRHKRFAARPATDGIRLIGPGRVAIQSQYEVEAETHYGWDQLGPDGSWRNWNPDPGRWRPIIREREPLYP